MKLLTSCVEEQGKELGDYYSVEHETELLGLFDQDSSTVMRDQGILVLDAAKLAFCAGCRSLTNTGSSELLGTWSQSFMQQHDFKNQAWTSKLTNP